MCHYQPKANRRRFDVQIASKFVSRLVLEEFTARDFEKREAFLRLLQGISKEDVFCGHLSEMKLHEQLVRGGIINTKCISNPDMPMKRFKLGNSKDFCFFSHDDLSRDMLQSGPYHIMRASNFESMDSFYYDPSGFKRMMLVFQTIVSSRFPVKGKGIVALLRAVGWLDKAQKDPTRVALMFVCVDESEKVIDRKQPIQWTPAVDGESVTVIPGIGDPMMTSLGRINVQTLGDFRSKISELKRSRKDWLLKCVKFEKFEEDQRLEWEMISRMPQYVWKM